MASDAGTSSRSLRSKYIPPAEDFTVGWICALPIECAAASCLLDREYHGHRFGSRYTLGRMGEHDVVIVCLPAGIIGTNSAASVTTQVQMEFKSIRIRLLVGIGGGVPNPADVRLGDVVISQPQNGHGGVIQYDFGKTGKEGRLSLTGFLNAPPVELLDAAARLRALLFEHKSKLSDHLGRFGTEFSKEQAGPDILYAADSEHVANASTCADCDRDAIVERPPRPSSTPVVHFGSIASANQVMKDGVSRDRWSDELGGVLCYEMEAAGLMMSFPSLVIRGICDYSDQHKKKSWQPFAAAAASAVAKEILKLIPVWDHVAQQRLDREIIEFQKEHPAPDSSVDYKRALQSRQPGTGIWLFENERYSHWKNHGSILWLYGIPGCGKTVLSAGIIEDLQSNRGPECVSYFYFVFDDSRKQVAELMIRSLIYQLLVRRARPSAVRRLSSGRYTSMDDLMEILYQLVQEFPHVYVVIDALDECGDRSALMSVLEIMLGWQLKELHLLVTSRMERDLEDGLGRVVNTESRICLQSSLVDPDIHTYVHTQLLEQRSLRKWREDPVLCEEIKDTIARGACGMFRWATCQLDQIAKCRNRSQLRNALSSLPSTLNATYDRILQNIQPQDIEYAVRILRWLAFSERPLLVEELAEAVAISVDSDPKFDPEQILQDAFESLDICSSLVTVSSASDSKYNDWTYSRSTTKQTVSLAHYSVKEYLVDHAGMITVIPNMQEIESHKILAMSCIAYLSQFDTINRKRLETARLAKYCSLNWALHSQKGGSKVLEEQIISFLLSKSFISFNKLYNVDDRSSPPQLNRPLTDMPTPLSVAVYFRLADIVQSMIWKGVDVNQHRGRSHSALQMAAKVGDLRILEILLISGADVNAQGGDYHTALHAAAARGHAEIVRQLLAVKADVNASGGCCESVLRGAVWGRSVDIVGQVLAAGADVNAQLQSGSVLHTATMQGELEIVQQLLVAGADADSMHPQFGSVLSTAAYCNHLLIVEELIEAGACANTEGGDFGTPLHAAAYRGHFQIVYQLILAGAAVNVHIEGIGSPLHAAVSSLSVDSRERDLTVRMLLVERASVNAFAKTTETPLHSAAHRGYESTVQLLIDWGADVDVKDHIGMKAVDLAEAKGYTETAYVLKHRIVPYTLRYQIPTDKRNIGKTPGYRLRRMV